MKRKGERDLALIVGMAIVLVVVIGVMIVALGLVDSVRAFIEAQS